MKDLSRRVNRHDKCWECSHAIDYLRAVGRGPIDEERPATADHCLLCMGAGRPVVVSRDQETCARFSRVTRGR